MELEGEISALVSLKWDPALFSLRTPCSPFCFLTQNEIGLFLGDTVSFIENYI